MTATGHPPLSAVFFDMDGTLVDSEPLTDVLILSLVEEYRLPPPDFSLSQLHGVTWAILAETLVGRYPSLADVPLVDRLQHDFHRLMLSERPPLIQGAQQAFSNASRVCPTGVVSSSPRETVEATVGRVGLSGICSVLLGAEDVQCSKPDPECYLLAAERLAADPGHCLVFEDSVAGLQAARTAGMYAVGVIGNRDAAEVAHIVFSADLVIKDYGELAADFFAGFGSSP